MNGIVIAVALLVILLLAMLIIGIVLLVAGKKVAGIIVLGIPVTLIIGLALYEFYFKMKSVPKNGNLIGTYYMSEANGLLPDSSYKSYKLELKQDGTYTLTPNSAVNLGGNGEYTVDWRREYSQLNFTFLKTYNMPANIDTRSLAYKIEFIVGHPDDRKSVFFTQETN